MKSETNIHATEHRWNHRTTVIRDLVQLLGAKSYLEIGYGDGANFAAIQCARKSSVDPAEGHYASAVPTHRMTSDEFFAHNQDSFDVIFIDGLHHADQVERDMKNSLAALNRGGAVVVHDLNPTRKPMQVVPRRQKEWTGDGWKAWVKLRGKRPSLPMWVVDADYGVGVILPTAEPPPPFPAVAEEDLVWKKFNRYRQEWLNLVPPDEAKGVVMEKLRRAPSRSDSGWKPSGHGRVAGPTALILFGVVHRSLRHVIQSLRSHVIGPLAKCGEVDIFFHSWDVTGILNPRAGENGVEVNPADIARWLPEATGIIESQEEFDGSVDWNSLFFKNPMEHCTKGEEAARLTLMNLRRALESQERAWRFFKQTKSTDYERVVVSRPDLLFLQELDVEPSCGLFHVDGEGVEHPNDGRLWVPRFHAWGGVNDRFAMGSEEMVGIWCNRSAFFDGWMLNAGSGNAEWLLMKWLERNHIKVRHLDFVFQRMRANGEVEVMDRKLKVALHSTPGTVHPTPPKTRTRERFLVLAREAGVTTEGLRKVLEPLGKVEVIVDRILEGEGTATAADSAGIWITDEEAEGYGGLMSKSGPFPKLTAWSRAFVHLERTLEDDEAVWFVEDDVAGDPHSFAELVRKTSARRADLSAIMLRRKCNDEGWPWWGYGTAFFRDLCRGFQPLCRLGPELVRAVLEFRRAHGKFTFHEVLFPSLVRKRGMRTVEWSSEPEFKNLFPAFRYRPNVTESSPGISHPVKDARIHGEICSIRPPEFPRLVNATYDGWAILTDDYLFLARYCRRHDIARVAEFGLGDSTRAFLDAGCRVVSYEDQREWLGRGFELFENEHDLEIIQCPEGTNPDIAPFEPQLVFVNGRPYRKGQTLSRLQPCEWALETCGCFLLHNPNREGEKAMLAEMERRGMCVTRIPTQKGIAMVADPVRRPEMVPSSCKNLIRYRGEVAGKWFVEDFQAWTVMLSAPRSPVRALETGASDGMSMNLMLDELFPHPESEIHGVDLYDGDAGNKLREDFETNAELGGHAGRLYHYEGTSREVMAWMIAGKNFWENLDFIHLNSAGDASQLLGDACQAWSLLKPGGILAFGGSIAARPGVEAFLSVHEKLADRLFVGRRVVLRKRG